MSEGLESGIPSFAGYYAAKKKLIKDMRWKEAHALDVVVAGGGWPGGREGIHKACHRCGQDEDAWHRYWGCQHLRSMDEPGISKSEWIKQEIEDHYLQYECL